MADNDLVNYVRYDENGIRDRYIWGCKCTECFRARAAGKPEEAADVTSLQRPEEGPQESQAPEGQAEDEPTGPFPAVTYQWKEVLSQPFFSPSVEEWEKLLREFEKPGTLVNTPLRVKWMEDVHEDKHFCGRCPTCGQFCHCDGRPDSTLALHPHSNCPTCKENQKAPEPGDEELQVLISCMRTSAQDTLIHLHKAGYVIKKA